MILFFRSFLVLALLMLSGLAGVAAGPGRVAYVNKFGDIRLAKPDGTDDQALTSEEGGFDFRSAALSGDGQWLAADGVRMTGGFISGLWVFRAAETGVGNEPVLVDPDLAMDYRIAWHPGGRFVAYVKYVGSYPNIFVLQVFDEEGNITPAGPDNLPVQMTSKQNLYFQDPAFSPDGDFLAVVRSGSVIQVMRAFDEEGELTPQSPSNEPVTVSSGAQASWPCWSPDGRKLVVKHIDTSVNPQKSAVAVLSVRDQAGNLTPENSGSNPRVLLTAPIEDQFAVNSPSWSPNGTLIAFSTQTNDAFDPYNVYAILAGSPEGPENIRIPISKAENGSGRNPSFMQVGGPSLQGPPMAPVPKNLAAWWTGNDSVADIFGGHHLSMGGGQPAYGAGKIGRAFTFDGSTQSYVTAETPLLNQVPLTIEGWVKPELRNDSAANAVHPPNVISNDKYGQAGHGFGLNVFEGGASELIIDTQAGEFAFRTIPDVAFEAGVWYHIAVVYSEGNAKTYVNGELVDDVDFTQGEADGETFVRVGRHNEDASYGTLRFFKGAIDELSVYARDLGEEEIATIYANSVGGKKRDDAGRQFITDAPQVAGSLWTYGTMPPASIDPASFVLAPVVETQSTDVATLVGWLPAGSGDRASVNANISSETFSTNGRGGPEIRIAPHQNSQHPGPDGTYSVLRWTAPAAGRYAVSGSFTGIDAGGTSTDVHVYHNATPLFGEQINFEFLGEGHVFTGMINAEAGDTVDFIIGVGLNGTYSYDSTGLVASVVAAGESMKPGPLAIVTAPPPTTSRQWLFTTALAAAESAPVLRVQFAEAGEPDSWSDLPVTGDSNAMTAPDEGSDVWSLAVNPLPLDAGNYYFRVVASIDGSDSAGARSGAEALGGDEGPISISAPGQPPPEPPPVPMPPTTALSLKINNKQKVASARQGQTFEFTATQPYPVGMPKDTRVHIQYSTNPSDEESWEDLPDSRMDLVSTVKSTRTYRLTTGAVPSGDAVYFRTSTEDKDEVRSDSPGPVVNNAVKPIGPIGIVKGPYWEIVTSRVKSSSDGSGKTAYVGDTLTYEISFENEGEKEATDVLVTMTAPTGTVISGKTAEHLDKATATKVTWFIPSVAPGKTIEKELKVTVKAKVYSTITCKNSNLTVKCDEIPTTEAIPAALRLGEILTTQVLPGLRIYADVSENIASAGETLDYQLNVENPSGDVLKGAVATFRLPDGVSLEFVRLADENGNFASTPNYNPDLSSNPSAEPYVPGGRQLITWQLGDLPAHSTRNLRLQVRVQYDLPSFAYVDGVSETTALSADDYNVSALSGEGKQAKLISAYKSAPPPLNTLISGEAPASPPQLSLIKTAQADGLVAGDDPTVKQYNLEVPGLGTATTAMAGSRITYALDYANAEGADAGRNVTIHDEIPEGVTFIGWIRRNGELVESALGFTFRNQEGLVIPSGGEPWTDRNHNGKADKGEWTDTNGNKKFDAFTDTRFLDINLGALGGGASGTISYEVAATAKEGTPIISRSGGSIIPKNKGVQYAGFSITSENLFEPIPGNPTNLISLIVAPATIDTQTPVANVSALVPGGKVSFEIPYRINGGEGMQFQDMSLKLVVPKNYTLVQGETGFVNTGVPINGQLRPLRAPLAGESFALGTPDKKTGGTPLTFSLGGLPGGREGVVRVTISVANPMPAELLDKNGYVKQQLFIRPEMTGRAVKPVTLARQAKAITPVPSAADLFPASSFGLVSPMPVSMSQLFVGRVVPISVQRGEQFKMTLFFGNATNRSILTAQIFMKVPPGTSVVHVSPTRWLYYGQDAPTERNMYKPLPNATKPETLVFDALDMHPHDTASVTVTLQVDDNFQGGSIQDLSLTVRAENAFSVSAPRMAIEVRSQNFFTVVANFFGGLLGNIFGNFNAEAAAALEPHTAGLTATSRQIGVGGASFVHLMNGSIVIPLLGGQTFVVGPSSLVTANRANILADDGGSRLVAGDGYTPGFEILNIPNAAGAWSPGDVIEGLKNKKTSLVAAGGGNLVAAGGGNLIGMDGSTLIDNYSGISSGVFLRPNNANLVAAGGGNMVAAGGGNIVAAGGGNLIGMDGSTMVAAGAGNLIGMDGSTLVAAGGGNLVAAGGGNMVAAGGLNFAASDKAKLIGLDGGSLVAAGGGNILASQATSLLKANAASVLSHNGGTILSHNGGVFKP